MFRAFAVNLTEQDISSCTARLEDALKLGRSVSLNYEDGYFTCEVFNNKTQEALYLEDPSLSIVLAAVMKGFIQEIKEEQN